MVLGRPSSIVYGKLMPIKRQSLLPCSKSDLVFEQPSDRPAGRLLCVAEEIAHLIFEFSIWREAHGAHDGWADEMLLAGEGACMCYVVDGPVELDGGIDVAINSRRDCQAYSKPVALLEPRPTSREKNTLSVCKLSTPRTLFSSF